MNTVHPVPQSSLKGPLGYGAKRIGDILFAFSILFVSLPVLGITALLIRITMGCPVLFRQVRPGYAEAPFTMFKFRTMAYATDAQGEALPDSQRLTQLGSFLRMTSLDELPEFWNVLRGEMSVVGPRPLLMKYLPFFADEERTRFSVRPGITGWAQINGRNAASWDDRLRNDVWYVQNCGLLLDVRILWSTLVKIVTCKHVVVDARSAMLNFDEERIRRKVGTA
jgi:sugar transferase EpsL